MRTVWVTALTLVITPYLINLLGTAHYGLFVLLMSLSGFMQVMDFGLGEATLRYVAYYYGRNDIAGINRVVGATFFIYVITGAIAWLVLTLAAPWVVRLLELEPGDHATGIRLIRLVAVNVGLVFFVQGLMAIPAALQRHDLHAVVVVGQQTFYSVGALVLVVLGFGIYALGWWTIGASLFTIAICLPIARHLIPALRMRPVPSRAGFREVFRYGVYALLTRSLQIVWMQADRWLLGAFVGAGAVAFLSVPQGLIFRALDVTIQMGAALFPRFSTTEDHGEIIRLYTSATWATLRFTVLLFVPMAVILPDFLRIWISEEFARNGALVGQVIAVSSLVRGAFVPYEALFRGMGKPQYITKLVVLVAGTGLIANLILIPRFGLAGAGYCFAISPIWGVVTVFYTWRRVLRQPSWRPLLRVFIVPTLLGFGCVAGLSVVHNLLGPAGGWLDLILRAVAYWLFTMVVVIGSEYLVAGRTQEIEFFYKRLRGILLKHRGNAPC